MPVAKQDTKQDRAKKLEQITIFVGDITDQVQDENDPFVSALNENKEIFWQLDSKKCCKKMFNYRGVAQISFLEDGYLKLECGKNTMVFDCVTGTFE